MKSSYDINYRGGWMQPTDEYIPEIIPPKSQWTTTNRLPDYGPVVEDNHKPTNHFDELNHLYQKIQYTKSFPDETLTTEFENEPKPFDLPKNHTQQQKQPLLSSQRESLHFKDTFDNQNISKREWQQRKLKGITNTSNLDTLIRDLTDLWQDVNVFTSNFSEMNDEENPAENLTVLQTKLESLPEENIRIDAEELDELRDLGVVIPQRVNRAETVRKTLQRHIDKLESFTKKNI